MGDMTTPTKTRAKRSTSANHSPPSLGKVARDLLPPPEVRKELRLLQGLTQEQAAAEFGVTDGSMSNWENNRPGPRHLRQYLKRLIAWADDARAMGYPITWPAPAPSDHQK